MDVRGWVGFALMLSRAGAEVLKEMTFRRNSRNVPGTKKCFDKIDKIKGRRDHTPAFNVFHISKQFRRFIFPFVYLFSKTKVFSSLEKRWLLIPNTITIFWIILPFSLLLQPCRKGVCIHSGNAVWTIWQGNNLGGCWPWHRAEVQIIYSRNHKVTQH